MIFCETGDTEAAAIDTLAVFVSQLRANGLPAVISEESILGSPRVAHEFDLATFLTHAHPNEDDCVILLAAHKVGPDRGAQLREFARSKSIRCFGFGEFATRQAQITVAARLAYAFNCEPVLSGPVEHIGLPPVDVPIFGAPLSKRPQKTPTIGLFFPDLANPDARATLRAMKLAKGFNVEIVTTGEEKKKWIAADGYNIPAWHLGELLPRSLAARFDAAVFCSKPTSWPRFQMIFANLALNGAALIDATLDRSWQTPIPQMIAGPSRLSDLGNWMTDSVIPNLSAITSDLARSTLAQSLQLPHLLCSLADPVPAGRKPHPKTKPSILFVPTNGVGLGHAKRCSLVADAMRDDAESVFAAFPSCIGMLTASGFDTMPLVSRTTQRASHDNDVINMARLSSAARRASALVFDGGYVFDSVMRAAADNYLPSVWVRRGLWQASQNNQVALDRQKSFTRVVVPTEAFDELNGPMDRTENVIHVGPIVQRIPISQNEVSSLKTALSDEVGLSGKRLVVTMLGGGVAADRRAQINAVCAHLSACDDVMHLLVVWPTATTDPGWFHYKNTRVVQSIHASALIPMADLFISAIGYNSFHEAIYAHVPTIFIPQMASFMDDQRARGVAAAKRDLAILIEPWELLSLTHAIDECLNGRAEILRENLRGLNLPEPGIRDAAQAILEVIQ